MRKLILALMALGCIAGGAQAQQQQKFTADQGAPSAAPWPVTWGAGLAVNADVRVGGSAVASGNPLPVSVGNFPAVQPASQSGTWSVLADLRVAGNPVSTGNPVPIAGTVLANIGTTNGLALDTSVQAVKTTLGSPFQAGGSIGNTAFGISGTLPAFAATPTVNLGTLNGVALDTTLSGLSAKTPAIGTQTKAASRSTTPASDLSNIEPAGTAVTGATMPAGGTGVTGWLSAIWKQIAARAVVYPDATAVAVAANGTSGGAQRDSQTNGIVSWTRFNATFQSNQAGTAVIYGSNDGSTLVTLYNQAMTANTVYPVSMIITFRYYYASIANGSAAATVNVTTGFTTN